MQIDIDKLQARRKERGWSLSRLAVEAGITYSTIWAIERDERQPQVATVKKIADALGCEVADLERVDGDTPAAAAGEMAS